VVRRVEDAERSKAVYLKRRFRRSRLSKIPSEYSTALDKKRAGFAQTDRARDCREFPFAQTFASSQTKGTGRICSARC
jgi:hypothetical protein